MAAGTQFLTRPSKWRVWVIAAVALVAVVGVLGAIKGGQIAKMINASKSFAIPPESVTSAKVDAQEWQAARSAVGTLVAIRAVTLASEVSGLVREIGFESGTFVRKGDVMVKLDTSTEEAQLASAEADAELARASLHRARSLREANVSAPADLDTAEAKAKQTAANVGTLKATIAKKTIRAPFDGRVSIKQVELGQVLASGTPVVASPRQVLIKQYERSNLATDIPHRIVGNFIYSLPFGRGQRFGGNVSKWADLAIGGWKLNGIAYVQSGNPLGLTQTGGQAFSGSRPTYVPDVNPVTSGSSHGRLGGAGQTQSYFNPAGFQLSRSFELGNVPRSAALLRSPLSFQNDLSAIKDFNIHESLRLQFRLEAFNVLNHPNWGEPNTTLSNVAFGRISSTRGDMRQIQFGLKLIF